MKTCVACGLRLSDKSFRVDGRTRDNLTSECADCRNGRALSLDEIRDLVGVDSLDLSGGEVRVTLSDDDRARLGVDRLYAVWSAKYINDLPDSAFLHIEPGGKKDADGKTTPRDLRHFPVKDADGNVDLPHLRNALSRIPQWQNTHDGGTVDETLKTSLVAKAQKLLKTATKSMADAGIPELETVDFTGDDAVEILAAGGPYFGSGSPPEGDHFDETFLRDVADASNALAREVRAPLKIGHNKAQRLLRNSGLADDEQPAAGWFRNYRVLPADGDEPAKLVADVLKVPKKLAALMKAGSFRTRSAELSRIKSQRLKRTFDAVITGVALLGAKAPAIRTLDEWIGQFEDADEGATAVVLLADDETGDTAVYGDTDDVTVEAVRFVDFASPDVVWAPEEGMEWIRSQVQEALNPAMPGPGGMDSVPRYWVRDLAPGKALVCRYTGGGDETWIVPFSMAAGTVTLAPAAEWIAAEQAWVRSAEEAAEGYAETLRVLGESRDTSGVTAKTKFTEEQIKTFASALGIDETDAAKLREAVEAKLLSDENLVEPPAKPAAATELPDGVVAISAAELAALKAGAEAGTSASRALAETRRDAAIQEAVDGWKLDPAKVEEWRGFYDENPDLTTRLLADLPVNEELRRTYGSDKDTTTTGDDDAYRAFAAGMGIEVEERAA